MMTEEIAKQDATSDFFDFVKFSANENADLTQYFLSSFSVLADDAELWRRYGDQGAGVAIVFDARRLGTEPHEQNIYHLGRVTYALADQTALMSALFDSVKIVLREYVQRHGYDVREVAIQMLIASLQAHLTHHGVALKSQEWHVEQEWQMVFSLLANDPQERHSRVQLQPDGRPFVDIRVRSAEPYGDRMPIFRVVAGPRADPTLIRNFLHANGYNDVPIVSSAAAF